MGVTELLSRLVRINSVNPEWGGPGEGEIAAWVKRFFEERNIETLVREILPGRPNVIARIPGRNPERRVVLEAHMDTVTAAGMTIPPFEPELRDGKLYGRGSVDVKAGLAAMMHAVSRIDSPPPCEIWLAAVIDEEHYYRGVLGLLEDLPGAEAAIVAEPTENRIVRANKGVLRFRIHARGKAAHSAMPHLGKNAIDEMAQVLLRLKKLHESLGRFRHPLVGSSTGSVGLIEGGTQVNIVPERCVITVDRRMIPGESASAILEEYRGLLADLDAELEAPYLVDEAMETPEAAAVVQTARRALGRLGGEPDTIGVPYGCDVTKLSRAGVPGIIFGPGSIDRAHTAAEYVEIDQLEAAALFYEAFIREFE